MAQTSYPLPPNRIILDAEFERLERANGADGVLGHPADTAVVYGDSSGMQVKVRPDKVAHLRGFCWESGGVEFTKTIDPNSSGATRMDLVVLRLTRATWVVSIEVRKGTPGSGLPAAVRDLGSTGVYEIPIAQVTVINGAATISAANVKTLNWYVGDDGQIICTSETRPDPQANRRIQETDTGRLLVGTGSSWLITREDTGWVALTMEAGWRNNNTKIRRVNGIAYLNLDVDRSGASLAASTSSNILRVPTEYRIKSGEIVFASCTIYHGKVGRVSCDPTGYVTLSNHEGILQNQYLVTSLQWPVG